MGALALFHSQHWLVANLPDKADRKFFFTSIIENSANYKRIYEICNNLLGRSKDSPLPPGIPNRDLPVSFNNYFIEKIAKIHFDLIRKHQQLLLGIAARACNWNKHKMNKILHNKENTIDSGAI